MSLDGIVVRALVHELGEIVGARIAKIYQPTENEVVLHIRGQGFGRKLLLSAHPSMPRLHYTEQPWANPQEPPMFCMLLRKHCEGGIIEAVRQLGAERIVEIDVRHRDELGDLSLKRLVLEIMGRHSNLVLLDPATGIVHDSIRHVTPAISSYRVVLPGVRYVAPPAQDKRNPLEATAADVERALSESAGSPPAGALVEAFTGFSPLLAKEIVFRAGGREADIPAAFAALMADAAAHRYAPSIVEEPSGRTLFHALPLTHAQGEVRGCDSMHACLETYYIDKAARDLVRQRTVDLTRLLQNETAKNVKKLEKLRQTLEEAAGADKYRRIGELLTAHLYAMSKGDKQVEVTDYYEEDQPTVRVQLDPLLTPNENAQRYFRKYTKMKNSRDVVTEQIEETGREIAYLESVLQGLDTATPADIEEIRAELTEQGYIRARGGRKGDRGKKKNDRPAILCYTSSEGVPIYVGKNNTQNDYVTNRLGQPNDTWLHTKDMPGSHVLIRAADYGEQTLKEAAMLAAYYSKGKESSLVPVDYTKIRLVRKPSGAKPGFVIYEGQKTLFITPDESLVRELAGVVKKA
ncbi:Rqc2 family fibronectin-binding protein [Cohnella rhizosphaerae]|uniref:Rqc2 homolog RqcH n=1 Tax=Cohnella rhizosphaerae TaxID=1457232 RepID=A0A9X4KW70_9BACL|nr:NFACT RNA binding domain-containing protein [Cohnella rhizosphaerae]MDG0812329.1 NFACT family protein [Cohnella rhizosphaerae]